MMVEMSETSWEWMQQNQISTMSKYSEKGGGVMNHHGVDMHRQVGLPKRKRLTGGEDGVVRSPASCVRRQRGRNADGVTQETLK